MYYLYWVREFIYIFFFDISRFTVERFVRNLTSLIRISFFRNFLLIKAHLITIKYMPNRICFGQEWYIFGHRRKGTVCIRVTIHCISLYGSSSFIIKKRPYFNCWYRWGCALYHIILISFVLNGLGRKRDNNHKTGR